MCDARGVVCMRLIESHFELCTLQFGQPCSVEGFRGAIHSSLAQEAYTSTIQTSCKCTIVLQLVGLYVGVCRVGCLVVGLFLAMSRACRISQVCRCADMFVCVRPVLLSCRFVCRNMQGLQDFVGKQVCKYMCVRWPLCSFPRYILQILSLLSCNQHFVVLATSQGCRSRRFLGGYKHPPDRTVTIVT